MIAGVCGGVAECLGWSSSRVRVVWVLATLFTGAFPGLILYCALWFLMPKTVLPESPPLQPWKNAPLPQ
jgi:phage shock protein PspC (stress-responsive transcriptional regulator)